MDLLLQEEKITRISQVNWVLASEPTVNTRASEIAFQDPNIEMTPDVLAANIERLKAFNQERDGGNIEEDQPKTFWENLNETLIGLWDMGPEAVEPIPVEPNPALYNRIQSLKSRINHTQRVIANGESLLEHYNTQIDKAIDYKDELDYLKYDKQRTLEKLKNDSFEGFFDFVSSMTRFVVREVRFFFTSKDRIKDRIEFLEGDRVRKATIAILDGQKQTEEKLPAWYYRLRKQTELLAFLEAKYDNSVENFSNGKLSKDRIYTPDFDQRMQTENATKAKSIITPIFRSEGSNHRKPHVVKAA